MVLSDNAKIILNKRYVRRDKSGEPIEEPDEVFERVANFVASKEEDDAEWGETFYELMSSLKFLPNSPTLVNAGTPKGSLSACFVMSPDDTMESIMDIAYKAALVEKWGGGVGFGLSKIRPKNDAIHTTHGKALGPLGVMSIYSHIAAEITQGSFRSGAHMAQLNVSHPDILQFIHCKDNVNIDDKFSNFNVSVQVTDEFMQAVLVNRDWNLVNPKDLSIVATVKSLDLWTEICNAAWRTGDPGLSFIDRVRSTHVNPHLGLIESSNPCGEQNLEDYGSCNLGSINLAKHITADNKVDWETLAETVRFAVRFLDNVIDLNTFPINEIENMNRKTRRIGLGVMGWADMLMTMGMPYASKEAYDLAASVGGFINDHAWEASTKLAQERGPFPEFYNSKFFGVRAPVRNSCVTTIAPTGTISRIAGCSSGIEPYFSLSWKSNILWEGQKDSETTEVIDTPVPVRLRLIELIGEEQADMLLEEVAENPSKKSEVMQEYGVENELFLTAMDIPTNAHIIHQSMWQKNISNAVSKTVNLPQDATAQDVSNVYLRAWQLGCKGVTVYRSGSRDKEVLMSGVQLSDEMPTSLLSEDAHEHGADTHEHNEEAPDLLEYTDEPESLKEAVKTRESKVVKDDTTCPMDDCDGELVMEGGCISCNQLNCGWSMCP